MIKLVIIAGALLVAWQVFRMATRKASLEEARTVGLEKARSYIQSPVLLDDYAETRGLNKAALSAMVERGEIPAYYWKQYTYIENRELIKVEP